MRNIFYVFVLLFFALTLFAEPVKHDAFTVQYNANLIPNESLAGKNPENYHRAVPDIEKAAGLNFERIKTLER